MDSQIRPIILSDNLKLFPIDRALLKPKDIGRVAVLLGGKSEERSVSLRSGQAVVEALSAYGVDVTAVDTGERSAIQTLYDGQFDIIFIALHGTYGEDGCIQGLLEMLALPYTGSGVSSSALCMDKTRTKLVWQALGLPTPAFKMVSTLAQLEVTVSEMGLPLTVKPVSSGSSVGVFHLSDEANIQSIYEQAHQYGDLLVERTIIGEEYTVPILSGAALPAIKIVPGRDFYDYAAKYESGDTSYLCPCGLSIAEEKALQLLAQQAYEALGCTQWARADFMRDNLGRFWLLEMNTIPGLTETSLVPKSCRSIGIDFTSLIVHILGDAISAYQQRQGQSCDTKAHEYSS